MLGALTVIFAAGEIATLVDIDVRLGTIVIVGRPIKRVAVRQVWCEVPLLAVPLQAPEARQVTPRVVRAWKHWNQFCETVTVYTPRGKHSVDTVAGG